ncbi:MAG TPA: hypothetical protein VGA70_06115 [Longimicrobiales bacterium]|jgi:hypothetical protein
MIRWLSLGLSSQTRVCALAMALGIFAAPGLSAQVCRGGTDVSPGWIAVGYGRASGNASVIGADFARRLSQSFSVFGVGDLTAYPAPGPRRSRLGIGGAFTMIRSNAVDVCLTAAIERERITNLTVLRVPVGVALAWSTTFASGRARFGLHAEPSLVYTHKSIATYTHTSGPLSGRIGMVIGFRRLIGGLEFVNAFDNDAKWNARVRLGVTV